MNKASIEYNTAIKPEDKKKILDKQEKLRKKFLLLSEKLRINNLKAEENAKRKLDNDNSGMTVGDINNDISDSDMVIFSFGPVCPENWTWGYLLLMIFQISWSKPSFSVRMESWTTLKPCTWRKVVNLDW
jgi:hypothetical protein